MPSILAILVLSALAAGQAWAYGGGGGSSLCAEPSFLEPSPTGPVTAFSEFNVLASDNTDIDTLSVEINGQKIQPAITPRRNGDFEIKAILSPPLTQAGKVRIALNAKSKEGCWGFQPYTVEIKP